MGAKEGGKRDRVGVWCPQGSGGRQFPGKVKPKLGLLDLRAGVATQGVNGSGEEALDVSELGRGSCPTVPPSSASLPFYWRDPWV